MEKKFSNVEYVAVVASVGWLVAMAFGMVSVKADPEVLPGKVAHEALSVKMPVEITVAGVSEKVVVVVPVVPPARLQINESAKIEAAALGREFATLSFESARLAAKVRDLKERWEMFEASCKAGN